MGKLVANNKTDSKIGKYIKKRRQEINLTQEQLAALTEVSTNHISSIETGASNPSYDLLIRLSTALHTTPDYFLLGELHSNNVSSHITYLLSQCTDHELAYIEMILEAFVKTHDET